MRSIESMTRHRDRKAEARFEKLYLTETQKRTLEKFIGDLFHIPHDDEERKTTLSMYLENQPEKASHIVYSLPFVNLHPSMAGSLAFCFEEIDVSVLVWPSNNKDHRLANIELKFQSSKSAGSHLNSMSLQVVFHKQRWWLGSDWEEISEIVTEAITAQLDVGLPAPAK